MVRIRSVMFSLLAALAVAGVGCESPNRPASTRPAYQPADGRNLPPSIQSYSTDPQWPYNEHQGGGGGQRR